MALSCTYQVKDVARLAGVSVRTLHHYDAIGLLVPGARTSAGYRLYTDADLLRLQQILIGRELGLSLEEIRRSLDDPRFDRKATLLDQRERLRERERQTEAMIRAIDVALGAIEGDPSKGEMNMEELFGGFNASQYDEEARRQGATRRRSPNRKSGRGTTGPMTGKRSRPSRPRSMTMRMRRWGRARALQTPR